MELLLSEGSKFVEEFVRPTKNNMIAFGAFRTRVRVRRFVMSESPEPAALCNAAEEGY